MWGLLAGDAHLLGDEVVHGHPAAEGASGAEGGTRNGALGVVGEVDDGAVGDAKGGDGGLWVGHVGESGDDGWGFGKEEVLVGGEGLGGDGDMEVLLD